MAYDVNFTLAANGTVVHWLARPPKIDYDYLIKSAKHPIPGTQHSIRQSLGKDSTQYSFRFLCHDLDIINTTGVMIATDPQDIVKELEEWASVGRVCTWISDEVTQGDGLASLAVKIIDFRKSELEGAVHKYEVQMTLEAYWT